MLTLGQMMKALNGDIKPAWLHDYLKGVDRLWFKVDPMWIIGIKAWIDSGPPLVQLTPDGFKTSYLNDVLQDIATAIKVTPDDGQREYFIIPEIVQFRLSQYSGHPTPDKAELEIPREVWRAMIDAA